MESLKKSLIQKKTKKGKGIKWNKQTNLDGTDRKRIDLNPTTLTITSNVGGLKTPNKRHFVRVSDQIKRLHKSAIHIQCKGTERFRVKGWKKIHHANMNQPKWVCCYQMSQMSGQGIFPGIRMTFYSDYIEVSSVREHNILNMHFITVIKYM